MNPDGLTRKIPRIETRADTYLKWMPLLFLLCARVRGMRMRHSFLQQAVLGTTTFAVQHITTRTLKSCVSRLRPGLKPFDSNSFPSAHTAVAFSGAELFRSELAPYSPKISYIGYLPAVATAYLRMAKRRHWLSDVLTGAIIGSASAYMTYRAVDRIIKHRRTLRQTEGVVVNDINQPIQN